MMSKPVDQAKADTVYARRTHLPFETPAPGVVKGSMTIEQERAYLNAQQFGRKKK